MDQEEKKKNTRSFNKLHHDVSLLKVEISRLENIKFFLDKELRKIDNDIHDHLRTLAPLSRELINRCRHDELEYSPIEGNEYTCKICHTMFSSKECKMPTLEEYLVGKPKELDDDEIPGF